MWTRSKEQQDAQGKQAHRLDKEFMACMVQCSKAWCQRWPKVDTVILDPPDAEEDAEDEAPVEEPEEELEEETPEEAPEEVDDGTTGDESATGGYHYNSFL